MEPHAEAAHSLPDMLHHYHSLYPLEDLGSRADQPSAVFGVPSAMLKGISLHNGQGHAIRRFDSRQVLPACGTVSPTAPFKARLCIHLCCISILALTVLSINCTTAAATTPPLVRYVPCSAVLP